MDACKKILKKETEGGRYVAKLQLFVQLDKGGTKSTGPHTVKLLSSKEREGQEFLTKKPRREISLLVEENGVKKTYNFPVFTYARDADGQKILDEQGQETMKLHYLIPKFADLPANTIVIMTGKKKGKMGFIDVEVVNGQIQIDDDIPIIEEDEPSKADLEEAFGPADSEES